MNSAPQATPPIRRLLSTAPPTSPGNPSHVAPLFLLEIWGAPSPHPDQRPLWAAWAASS